MSHLKRLATFAIVGTVLCSGLATALSAGSLGDTVRFKIVHDGAQGLRSSIQRLEKTGATAALTSKASRIDHVQGPFIENIAFTRYHEDFRTFVLGGLKKKLAKMVSYPLRGTLALTKGGIESERDFIKHFDEIFPPESRQLFYMTEPENLTQGSYQHTELTGNYVSVLSYYYDEEADEVYESAINYFFGRVDGTWKLIEIVVAG